jgi:hypothetical protein
VFDIGGAVPYAEAALLARQLTIEQDSHLFMALNGWDYPMSLEAMNLAALWVTVRNALSDEPTTYPWPWPDESKKPTVSADERAALVARLNANSAFSQVRKE